MFDWPGQAKITDLEQAVGVDKQISGFHIPMEYRGTVQILQSAQNLVGEHFNVVHCEDLIRHDDLVQVGLHQWH